MQTDKELIEKKSTIHSNVDLSILKTKKQTSQSSMLDVSIIIVNWNSGDYIRKTIESVYQWTSGVSFELIVLDNSTDKSNQSYKYLKSLSEKDNLDNLKVIFNKENMGFAKANNLGIDISRGKNILLLNPDVILKSNMVKILNDYLDNNPEVGMVGPKVLNPDGSFQASCMRGEPDPLGVFFALSGLGGIFKKHPKYYSFSLANLDSNKEQNVVCLSGCCLMIRNELIKQIGKMDEQFFLYQEETDWCYRTYKSGWKLVYYPEAQVIHDRGTTTRQKILKTNYYFCLSMMKFFKKHYFKSYNFFQRLFFIFFIWGNFLVRYIKAYFYYYKKRESNY